MLDFYSQQKYLWTTMDRKRCLQTYKSFKNHYQHTHTTHTQVKGSPSGRRKMIPDGYMKLHQRSENFGGLPPGFVNKVYLFYSPIPLFTFVLCSLLYNGRAEKLQQRLYVPQSLKYLLFDALQKKTANP